jgi:hypothetical protein
MEAHRHRENTEKALATCRALRREEPNSPRLRIAEEQLSLLLKYLLAGRATKEELEKIDLGLLAVREFEPSEFAEQIYTALAAKTFLSKLINGT